MNKLTLTNNFHNTEVTLVPKGNTLSPSQVKRSWRILCGISGCTCCNSAGARGNQEVELEFNQDGSAGIVWKDYSLQKEEREEIRRYYQQEENQ